MASWCLCFAMNDFIYISLLLFSFLYISQFRPISGQTTLAPLCTSDVYDISILKEATYWHAPAPGKCYDSYGKPEAQCDFYFSFCHFLPATLTGGRSEIGAVQNETQDASLALGGYSQIQGDKSGQLLIVGFSGGDEVGCGTMSGILMYLQCDPSTKWTLLEDGSGEIPMPVVVTLYNTTACSYNITLRYDGACTKIGPSTPTGKEPLSPGSILIIIFLCTAAIYLIGGVIMNCSAGATGLELLPNLQFWKSLPGLIADGAFYFWTCATCQAGGEAGGKSGYESI